MEARQPFSSGSVDSTVVDENGQDGESWPLAPVQEIRSRVLQLFDEQPTVRQPQPGEQFQVGDPLASSVLETSVSLDPSYSHPRWDVTLVTTSQVQIISACSFV